MTSDELRKVLSYAPFFLKNKKYDYVGWLPTNLHMYDAFAQHADEAFARDKEKLGARMIAEVARYWSGLRSNDADGWKYNHNYSPDLARSYVILHPETASRWIYHRRDWRAFLASVEVLEGPCANQH